MNGFYSSAQRGAVLVIALVMLVVLMLLTVSSIQGVVIETRMTGSRLEKQYLNNLVGAALREGELRFYGSNNLHDKLEAHIESNCIKNNTVKAYRNNNPCLLASMTEEQLVEFFATPVRFLNKDNAYTKQYGYTKIDSIKTAGLHSVIAWMPYRGLGLDQSNYYKPSREVEAYWNSYNISSDSSGLMIDNPEYGSALEGRGVYHYLITAQAANKLAVQSTIAVIYLGVNN